MLDSLELESRMVVSYHVGAKNQTWVLQKNSTYSQLLIHLCSPEGKLFPLLKELELCGYSLRPQTHF